MKEDLTYLALFIMLSGICGIGIWFIIDKDAFTNAIGIALFAVGLGSLFSLLGEQIIKEIKKQKVGDVA